MHDEMRILCTHLPYIETKMTSMTPNYNTASDLGIEGVVPTPIHKLLSIRMHAMIQYVVHAEHVITGQQTK